MMKVNIKNEYAAPAVRIVSFNARQMLCGSITDSNVKEEIGDGGVE